MSTRRRNWFLLYKKQRLGAGTQMPTEGTEFSQTPITYRRNQMAKVTYRGVEYDTAEYNAKVLAEAAQKQRHELMYRGIKVERKFASKS